MPVGMSCSAISAAEQTLLRVMVFHGVQNLPIVAARKRGFFADRKLDVDIHIAPSSNEMRSGLAAGRCDIVHGAVDNAVAMAEVQGIEVAVIMGGDNGFTELIVQPTIRSLDAIRGKKIVVDAPDTAFALMLYEVLARNGLRRDDYTVNALGAGPRRLAGLQADPDNAAAILNPPFSILARRAGLKSLGPLLSHIGPYLSTCGFAHRHWIARNRSCVERYVRGYVQGLRWVLQPSNKEAAVTLLAEWLAQPHDIAEECYRIAADRSSGFAPDARIDMAGFAAVLQLRANFDGRWSSAVPTPEKYFDRALLERVRAAP